MHLYMYKPLYHNARESLHNAPNNIRLKSNHDI